MKSSSVITYLYGSSVSADVHRSMTAQECKESANHCAHPVTNLYEGALCFLLSYKPLWPVTAVPHMILFSKDVFVASNKNLIMIPPVWSNVTFGL